ncbi:MAG: glutamate/aspartate transport system substrate-binding protein [Cellvibrionaceae bacterium]|jgi:glutamate/aspartate transport system substrate-binding protein
MISKCFFNKLAVTTSAVVLSASAFLSVQAQAAGQSFVLDRIKERGQINMGHRESSVPFSYIGASGEPIGYSIDICMKIIDSIKAETGVADLKVNFVPVTSQTRIALIANGTIDIECGSTTNNLTRQKQVSYLATTFITGTKIASKKGSGITDIEDMNGKVLAVTLGTTNEKSVKRIIKEKNLDIKILPAKDHSQSWLLVNSGRADAFAGDDVLLYGLISKDKKPEDFQVTGRFLSFDPYGIMVPQNDSTFQRLGNVVLADLMRDGELKTIYNKWFAPGPTNINMPISDDLSTAFFIQALPN